MGYNIIMDYANAFHIVAGAAKESSIPCVLVGGFAINFYKVTRNTLDIDFLITKEDFKKIENALRETGYKEEFATDVAIRFSNRKDSLDVDFMIVDEATRGQILVDGKEVELVGEKFVVPSLDHLLALKIHAIKHGQKRRAWKDLPDVMNLVEMNDIDARSSKFKELCLRYGNDEIYQTILKNCEGIS